MSKPKIWLSPPHMCGLEQTFVNDAFDTNWIAPLGPNVRGFENDLEAYLGHNSYVAALNSGTAAIHLALHMLGVRSGDEVICQSHTFAASVNPILYQGATPVFVDSEAETWNMCPDLLEKAIIQRIHAGKTPKAIIGVHVYGMPYKINEIHHIANRYQIPIIEDSAEALGSKYNNAPCGTFGHLSILSFNGNKIITTSGGGALVSKTIEDKERAVFLASQAKENLPHYQHTEVGYNYRMSNVLAGIGRGQMTVLEDYVSKRRANYNFYCNALQNHPYISFLSEPEGHFSNRWLTCVLLDSYATREGLRVALEKEQIDSRPLWKPMHQQPVFKDYLNFVNGVSDDLFDRGLCLPSGSNLTSTNLNRIISAINMYFAV